VRKFQVIMKHLILFFFSVHKKRRKKENRIKQNNPDSIIRQRETNTMIAQPS